MLIVSYRSHFWDKYDTFLSKIVTFQFLLSAAFTATLAAMTQLSFLISTFEELTQWTTNLTRAIREKSLVINKQDCEMG